MRLSRWVQLNPEGIDSSLKRLSCVSKDITEVDVDPTVLVAVLASAAPLSVQRAIAELPPHERRTLSEDMSDKSEGQYKKGLNTAIAFSLHTVLLSRNRITTTLGLLQFKNLVRLSLLGNRVQRIEDCEALSVLFSLQYLTLEFNPVTSLPHYRAHILRICSWPHSLQPKNCRLRKLDTRDVVAVEVEKAAKCLQREKVTMGELVQRMRFLSFLSEANKRITLHHELRRRGLVVQDIISNITVESVVTRCSAQLLTLVDVSAASHLARRLMSGQCNMCDMSHQEAATSLLTGEATDVFGSSLAGSSADQSKSGCTAFSICPVQSGDIKAFCKDWSRDVFRRASMGLDHKICELLISIARALGKDLSVMDVDHLNKLWFLQVAKVDKYVLHNQKNELNVEKTEGGSSLWAEWTKPTYNAKTVIETAEVEEGPVDKHSDKLHGASASPRSVNGSMSGDLGNDNSGVTTLNISPITQRVANIEFNCAKGVLTTESRRRVVGADKVAGGVASKGQDYETSSVELQLLLHDPPMPLLVPSTGNEPKREYAFFHIKLFAKRRIMRHWRIKTKQRRQDAVCSEFIRGKLTALVTTVCPTLRSICTMLGLLPKAERKRILLRFWWEQTYLSYAPELHRLRTLFTRWRWRAYEMQNMHLALAHYRLRALTVVWSRWTAGRCRRMKASQSSLKSVSMHAGDSSNGRGIRAVGEKLSQSNAATENTDGLTTSGKRSFDNALDVPGVQASEKTPRVTRHLSLLVSTPSAEAHGTASSVTHEKSIQTEPQCSPCGPANCRGDSAQVNAEAAVAALQADRLRLVDRIIGLEQRANGEAIEVQRRDAEILELRERLNALALREECMKTTLEDYKRKCEHLQAVVDALRTERREMLLSTVY
ncbi:hypothetical protein TRVL_09409 [Trypanosoma vivax]|nr:hypothetical protein TRVL_09409 [Trypanosoma vivax]